MDICVARRYDRNRRCTVPTNLNLDDKLIREALRLGKHKTKKDAVNAALQEYIRMKKVDSLLALAGTVDYDPTFDHKAWRKNKRR